MQDNNIYNIKLAKYLLNYKDGDSAIGNEKSVYTIDPNLYNETQINMEVAEILLKLRPYLHLDLKTFHMFTRHGIENHIESAREEKRILLEHHHFYDKYLLYILRDFTNLALALLLRLERMHKKNILCGNVNPYTFLYLRKFRTCEPEDLSLLLSDKETVNAERKTFGDYIYTIIDLGKITYNKYLAPELRQSLLVYHLQRRLEALSFSARARGIVLPQQAEIDRDLHDLHQKRIKYTNRAEIYSVGYTLNQIFSHTLTKHAHYNLLMHEFTEDEVPEEIVHEADLLLPDEFENHDKERIVELVNDAVLYVHDLMREHMEQRDTLELSIEKFQSLLKRISTTKQDIILEEEEAEEHEHEERAHEEHEHEEHEHAEHEHEEHEHEEHEHEEHEHEEHEHEEHEHEEHEHEEHEHEEHEHEEHEHEEHEHAEHEHEEHEHEEHEHEEHEHAEHEHAEHEHEEHEHEEHEHEEHEHEEHEHEEHEHEEHEHAEHAHETHGHAAHEEHHDNHAGGKHDAAGHSDDLHPKHHEDAHAASHGPAHVVDETGTRLPGGRVLKPGGGARH